MTAESHTDKDTIEEDMVINAYKFTFFDAPMCQFVI